MTAITESPVFVLFNPAARNAASKDLPITLYESGACSSGSSRTVAALLMPNAPFPPELHVVGDAPVLTFVKSAYTIEVCCALVVGCCPACSPPELGRALFVRSRVRRSALQSTT